MKNLDNIINEARSSNIEPTTIHFEDCSSWMLFVCELSGQITDGKYENTRPVSHMNWLLKGNVTSVVDGNTGYEGPSHKIDYNLREWPGYIKKAEEGDSDWEWSKRCLYYGAFGRVITKEDTSKYDESSYDSKEGFRSLAEVWGKAVMNDNVTSFKNVSIPEYLKKYIDNVSFLNTAANFKAFAKEVKKYTIKDLRADLASMEASVNITF